jgi:quinol monooxygenase YgiN
MKFSFRILLGFVVLAVGFALPASAETKLRDGTVLPDKPLHILSYIEVSPSSAAAAADLLKKQVAASQGTAGNLRFEALERVGRKGHFVILEAWTDPGARANHAKAAHTTGFRKALQAHLYNPYDERPHVSLDAADPAKVAKGTASTVYVITHVDIIPPEQFAPCKRQLNEAGPCGNELVVGLVKASRSHAGNKRFDVITQANRSNHMTVVEMWDSVKSQEDHQVTSDVKSFRDTLSGIKPGSGVAADPQFVLNPLTGSLYDERLYKLLN